jgi:hypothetical protein
MNMNDPAVGSTFHQLHYGIAAILLGGQPAAMVAYEDALSQYWKLVFVGIVALQVAGVILALRRIWGWQRRPERRPDGARLASGHVVLPLAADLAVTAALWWLVLDRNGSPIPLLIRYSPDLFLALVIVTILGIGWGLLRTRLTVHRPRSHRAGAEAPA